MIQYSPGDCSILNNQLIVAEAMNKIITTTNADSGTPLVENECTKPSANDQREENKMRNRTFLTMYVNKIENLPLYWLLKYSVQNSSTLKYDWQVLSRDECVSIEFYVSYLTVLKLFSRWIVSVQVLCVAGKKKTCAVIIFIYNYI